MQSRLVGVECKGILPAPAVGGLSHSELHIVDGNKVTRYAVEAVSHLRHVGEGATGIISTDDGAKS